MMEIIWFMVPAALVLGFGFVGFFLWAVKDGQFEDLETPALRILFDEKKQEKEKKK